MREITSEEGNRLLRIVRRTSASVVTSRRAPISHEGLRQLLLEESVRFQAVRTWKRSTDPDFKAKRDRIVELYEMAEAGEAVVICLDESSSSVATSARS